MSSTLYAAPAAPAFVVARPFAGAVSAWCSGLAGDQGANATPATSTTTGHANATGMTAGKRITPGVLGGRT